MAQQAFDDVSHILRQAQDGDVAAQYRLGAHYSQQGDKIRATSWLERAATNGYAPALYTLGTWRFQGLHVALDRGHALKLMAGAARAGMAEAQLGIAALVAAGYGGSADWAAGAGHVVDAATAVNVPALRQVAILLAMYDGGAPLADRFGAAAKARSAVAKGDLIAARERFQGPPVTKVEWRQVSDTPYIKSIAGFLSNEECDYVIACSRPHLHSALTNDPKTGRVIQSDMRTNLSMTFWPLLQDLVIHAINLRIADASDTAIENGEGLAILKYHPGEEYQLHYDCIAKELADEHSQLKESGQRVGTFLINLNDDFEGGETEFPRAGIKVKGNKGDAVFFCSVDDKGAPDEMSLHAGLPIISGSKWVAVKWIRERPFAM